MPTTGETRHVPDFALIVKLIAELDNLIQSLAKSGMQGISPISLRLPPSEPAVHAFYTAVSWLYVCLIEAGPVHFRFLAERAKAIGIDASDSLVDFRHTINNFRTVLQHNLILGSPDDAAKLHCCEKWMSSVLDHALVPNKRFWPENGEWSTLACALWEQSKLFFDINIKTVAAIAKDEFAEDAVSQWILRCTRSLRPHQFDSIAEEVAQDLGLTHLDVMKIRKAHYEKWSLRLRNLADNADIHREARRVVESTFLAEADDHSPVDGHDVIQMLGVPPGARVARVLQKARELYRQRPCSREELLKKLEDLVNTETI